MKTYKISENDVSEAFDNYLDSLKIYKTENKSETSQTVKLLTKIFNDLELNPRDLTVYNVMFLFSNYDEDSDDNEYSEEDIREILANAYN